MEIIFFVLFISFAMVLPYGFDYIFELPLFRDIEEFEKTLS